MKKVIVFVLAFFLVFTALAEKKTFYVYDADEHDYEGRVVWSSDARIYDENGTPRGVFIWHILNLKTGKYSTDESRDSYVIMDDGTIEGFLAAKEEDGYVTVYNVKSGYESEILLTCSLEEGNSLRTGLPMNVRGYMDEYLYYVAGPEENSSCEYVLKRKNMEGDEYEYSAYNGLEVALYKNGTCAWVTEDESELYIESPDRGVFMTLKAQDVDGADRLYTAVWLNEKKLLFWAYMPECYDGTLYSLNVETGKVKKYTDDRGEDIVADRLYSVTMDINEKLLVYMDESWDGWFSKPILLDLENGSSVLLYDTMLRIYGLNYSERVEEISTDEGIIVWIND